MDQSIERRFVVYVTPEQVLISCPADQAPPNLRVVFNGNQQQCERYMRDLRRMAQFINRGT